MDIREHLYREITKPTSTCSNFYILTGKQGSGVQLLYEEFKINIERVDEVIFESGIDSIKSNLNLILSLLGIAKDPKELVYVIIYRFKMFILKDFPVSYLWNNRQLQPCKDAIALLIDLIDKFRKNQRKHMLYYWSEIDYMELFLFKKMFKLADSQIVHIK
jgi:hypothetical protein